MERGVGLEKDGRYEVYGGVNGVGDGGGGVRANGCLFGKSRH